MNFFETTYGAFHGPGSSLFASHPSKKPSNFYTPPERRGPLWGFSEQTLPGVPGPQWILNDSTTKTQTEGEVPLPTTYADSYQFRRRHFNILNYDANQEAKTETKKQSQNEICLALKGDTQGIRDSSMQETAAGLENPLYASQLKRDRRHDTLSAPLTERQFFAEGHHPHAFDTSSRVIGKFSNDPNSAEFLFASQRGDERRHQIKERLKQPAGLDGFQDSINAFPPKLHAANKIAESSKQ